MKPNTSLRSFLALAGSSLLVASSVNATQFWDGTGGDDNWNTAANWGGDVLPAFGTTAINFGSLSSVAGTAFGNVVVPSQTTADNDLTAGTVIKGFVFGNTGAANRTQAYTLTGNSIVLGTATNDGITTTAIAAGGTPIQDIISLNMDLGSVGTHKQIIANLNHNLRIDGVISGVSTMGLIAARGLGTVTFNNTNNSYAGFTNIAEGAVLEVLKMDNGGANSSIGASSSANANLRFNFGFNSQLQTTLRHIGSANSSTDRGFIIYGNQALGTHSAIESSGTGTLSFTSSAAITFGTAAQPRNLYLGGTNTGDNVFNLAFGNNTSGVNTFTKQGVGKWINSGTNTYTGATTISAGTLQFAKQVSLYNNNTAGAGWVAANIKVANTATLALNVGGTGQFDTGNVTTLLTNLGGTNGTSTTGFAAGSKVGFDTTNASGGSFTVADVIADSTGAGGGAIGVTKLGTNTLVLSNANTYTGVTTVSGGTLLINGNSSTATGNVNVNAGTLGGTGATGGAIAVAAGAALAPGASIESLAAASLNMAATSTFGYEVASNTATGADLLALGSTVSLTSVTLSLDAATLTALGGGGWTSGNKLTLISYLGADITSGFTGYLDDTSYLFGSNSWLFNYNDTVAGGNYGTDAIAAGQNRFVTMTFVPVPEPRAALLGGLGLLALLRRRRA